MPVLWEVSDCLGTWRGTSASTAGCGIQGGGATAASGERPEKKGGNEEGGGRGRRVEGKGLVLAGLLRSTTLLLVVTWIVRELSVRETNKSEKCGRQGEAEKVGDGVVD